MDEDEGPFGSAPEPTPQPIPWESGPGGPVRRFLATQLALLAPSSLARAFGEGSTVPALRYAVLAAFVAGALRIPEWTFTLQFTSVRHVLFGGRPFVTLARGTLPLDVVLDALRAWGLGIAVHVACVAAFSASYASLGQSFDQGSRSDDGVVRRREALLRAALYLSTSLVLALVLRAFLVLVAGVEDRLWAELVALPAVFVMLRGLRTTAMDQCKLGNGGTLAVTVVPVVLLLASQMVLVDRLLAPLLPRGPSVEELEAAQRALDDLALGLDRDAGPRSRRDAGPSDAGAGDDAAGRGDAAARGDATSGASVAASPRDASLADAPGADARGADTRGADTSAADAGSGETSREAGTTVSADSAPRDAPDASP